MNINLNDKKIVKIVYKLDDGTILEFNYSDGELCSVTTPKSSLSDREMIDRVRKSGFKDNLEKAMTKYNIAKEIVDSFNNTSHSNQDKKCSSESLEIAKKIMKMDENGELDRFLKSQKESCISHNDLDFKRKNYIEEAKVNYGIELAKKIIELDKNGELDKIVKKHRNEIDNKISYDNDYKDTDGKQIDIAICNKSIKKLKDEILLTLSKLEKDGENNDEFWNKVDTYKEYVNKRNQLTDSLWLERIDKIDSKRK